MKSEDIYTFKNGIELLKRALLLFEEPQWTPEQEKDAETFLTAINVFRGLIKRNEEELKAYLYHGDAALVRFQDTNPYILELNEGLLRCDKNAKERL